LAAQNALAFSRPTQKAAHVSADRFANQQDQRGRRHRTRPPEQAQPLQDTR
jgi:hypothetical protein